MSHESEEHSKLTLSQIGQSACQVGLVLSFCSSIIIVSSAEDAPLKRPHRFTEVRKNSGNRFLPCCSNFGLCMVCLLSYRHYNYKSVVLDCIRHFAFDGHRHWNHSSNWPPLYVLCMRFELLAFVLI